MTPKKIKTRTESKSTARDYLVKATDNHDAMMLALQNNLLNSVGTLAMQCAISSADALCVYKKGLRSCSDDHFDVCMIIKTIPLSDATEKSNLLRKIIAQKNLIQYESRNIRSSEAIELVKYTNRFFQWVLSNMQLS